MAAAASLLTARRSITTSTSGLSQPRTSIAPSNVSRVRSGRPDVVKCLVSRSKYLPSPAPTRSMQAAVLKTAERAASAAFVRIMALDGGRLTGVSRVDQLSSDISLYYAEIGVEHDEIGHSAWRNDGMTDEAQLSRGGRRTERRRVDERQPDPSGQHLKRSIHRPHAARNGAVVQ